MNKKIIFTTLFISLMGTAVQAQSITPQNRKWDVRVENMFNSLNHQIRATRTDANHKHGFIVSCSNAHTVADAVRKAGFEASVINATTLCVNVPLRYIPTLADNEEVNYINGARTFYPTMASTRQVTGVDRIHLADGLETPFTGKGVIIGVIDQGFQYKHIAFLDKNKKSRVKWVWDHYNNRTPNDDIPETGDMIKGNGGHATHVTNIAAGSKIGDNNLHGIAPEADIIMVPSRFMDPEVLKEAKFIKDIAKKEGKRFVINMSFGSQIGPHDGTSYFCSAMDSISEDGGILVGAMGNDGDMTLHTSYTFKKANEKVYLVINPDTQPYHLFDLWATASNLKIKPFIYKKNALNPNAAGKIDYKNESFWRQMSLANQEIDPNNRKFHYYFEMTRKNLNPNDYLGFEIIGNTGDEFHAWSNPDFGQFFTVTIPQGKHFLQGDNLYCVGEGAAIIPSAIAVASYNGNDGTFVSAINGQSQSQEYRVGKKGHISVFSSRGPSLGDEPKPLVAAPGGTVQSAISKYGPDFNPKNLSITNIVNLGNNQKDYYAVMSGTSMATPAVTGIVALWLEANPELTYKDVKQIIKETSTLDEFTGTKNQWDTKRGYGKINAYAGLKKALEMAETTGINDQLNSETPITVQKKTDRLNVLFNNDESFAYITLYNGSGKQVRQIKKSNIVRGNEVIVSTNGLPSGFYLVKIQTSAYTSAKKILVK